MKKIKKLSEVKISNNLCKDEQLKLKGGGCEFDNCGVSFYLDYSSPYSYPDQEGKDPIGEGGGGKRCNCGCSGCSHEDGGSGFNIGMNLTNTNGHDCTWYSIF